MIGLDAVDAPPTGLESDLAARAEPLLLDDRDHRRACVAGRRMEDGEEPSRHEVEHTTLVRRHCLDVMVDVCRDDCMVIVDLGVVDDALQRQLIEREHVFGGCAVILNRLQRPRCRLQLRDHVAGEKA